jgi:NADPH:quinone reductase-like Zn-dependent oxidoreductase
MKRSGAFAPMLITTQNFVVKKPEGMTFEEAACLPIAASTAWDVLVSRGHLKRGQKVFINGAMGAVGRSAVAVARSLGAEIVGTVSPKAIDQGRALGLTAALPYTQAVPQSFNGTFDIVFDCNGSLSPKECKRLKKSGGKIFDIAPNGAKIFSSIFSFSHKIVTSDPDAKNLQPVVSLAASGKLHIPIARTIGLAQTSAELGALERGQSLGGKVVVAI